ncbi:MAG: hypothetical protein WCG98_01845 [bacterium]
MTPTVPEKPVVVTPTIPETPVVVTPTIPEKPVVTNVMSTRAIDLQFDDVSDLLAQHYISQWDMKATLRSLEQMHVGDEAILTITIKDQKTQEDISGLLPIVFEFITSNDNITIDYSSIKLVTDGKIEIHITAMQVGKSSLIINF